MPLGRGVVNFGEDIYKDLKKDLDQAIHVYSVIKNAQNVFDVYLKPSLYRCGIKKVKIWISPPYSKYTTLDTVKIKPINIVINSEKECSKDAEGEYFRHIFCALEIANTILAPLLDDLSCYFVEKGKKYFKTEISIHTFDDQRYLTRNSFLDPDGDEYY